MIVNVLVMHGEHRYVGGFSNMKLDGTIATAFEYQMEEHPEPFVFANGSGATQALADRHLDKIRGQLSVWPRRVSDHLGLLAAVNRRVASKDDSVSPQCQVSYINADDRTRPESHVFRETGEKVPDFAMPILLMGIDISDMARLAAERAKRLFAGEDPGEFDTSQIDEGLKRRE